MLNRTFPAVPDPIPADMPVLRQVLLNGLSGENSPKEKVHLFKKLFDEGREIARQQVITAISPDLLESMLANGFLEEENSQIRACFEIQLYRGLIFLSDFFQWENNPNFVLPIGPAGRYLADLTIRSPVKSTLDLGCGCGVQSLLASLHSIKVTATDVNPRAAALTRLNAKLNGITNIEVVEGSYFEPVNGKKFDLIVANLPYVITPDSPFIYRDVDLPGDGSLRKWLQAIPMHLEEGGFTHILINWIIRKDQSWAEPVQAYLRDLPLDAWLIYNGSKSLDEYTEIWIDTETKKDIVAINATRQSWLSWYREQGIQQIGLGSLTLRGRSTTKNWFRAIPVKTTLEGQAGEHFLRLFAAQDFLDSLESRQDLLKIIFQKVNLEINPQPGQTTSVYSAKQLNIQVNLNPETMPVLTLLDGKTILQQAIEKSLHQKKVPGDITQSVLEDVEMIIQLGLIVPLEY
jgi:SAM-dependent methyltransferase